MSNAMSAHVPGPELTIAHAAEQREALLGAVIAGEGPFHLDLATVEEFDSSGVQLLVALRHSLASRGRPLVIEGLSAQVADGLATFGLAALFPADAAAAH